MSYRSPSQDNDTRRLNGDIEEGREPQSDKQEGNVRKEKEKEKEKEKDTWYNKLFVLLRAIVLSLDTLFFFVPVIHEEKKCISEDKNMWINAIFWRSVSDFIYLVHVVKKAKEKEDASNSTSAKGQRHSWMWFMLDIAVILPIPQVLMSNILSEMRRAKYANNVTLAIMNAAILIQYGPRLLQIYLSMKKLKLSKKIAIQIKALFYLWLYLLAGQVFGACWYFFSTQRLAYCWRKACLHYGECVQGSFNCNHNIGNLSVLHDFCSIGSTNTSAFGFGIFLEARQSGILESTDFPKKIFYSTWWGWRNLRSGKWVGSSLLLVRVSSFGSNLQTSTYVWENAFAVGFSLFGLLTFPFVFRDLQVYMESKHEENSKIDEKLDSVIKELQELRQLCGQRGTS